MIEIAVKWRGHRVGISIAEPETLHVPLLPVIGTAIAGALADIVAAGPAAPAPPALSRGATIKAAIEAEIKRQRVHRDLRLLDTRALARAVAASLLALEAE